ncbi:MAG: DUF1211 domain-containing protein [Planctomycetes bacterium]|nr:DUF1211 domain-containing protein [Planctomycetota bacterium]
MIRGPLVESAFGSDPRFRWRSHEVNRVEAFSDAVFAFALTLLVVALEVPRTYEQLLDAVRGFPAFAACFALLYLLWYQHYTFFRRHGIVDRFVLVWNAVLVFLVLFFVYPLKFLFSLLFGAWMLQLGWIDAETSPQFAARVQEAFDGWDPRQLMLIYSSGYLAVSIVFLLLYRHAWKLRERLELDALERHITVDALLAHGIDACIGILSLAIAWFGSADNAAFAGLIYALLGPAHGLRGYLRGRRQPVRA